MTIKSSALCATALLLLLLAAPHVHAGDSPDAAMMAPVTALANYMAHVERVSAPPVFAKDGVVIVENFAPYVFRGRDAAARWDAGFRQHVAAGTLQDLTVNFGKAHDFDRSGDRAYFVLPTTWRGVDQGRRFEEFGAWAFVLTNASGQWRILSYAWGVTDMKAGTP